MKFYGKSLCLVLIFKVRGNRHSLILVSGAQRPDSLSPLTRSLSQGIVVASYSVQISKMQRILTGTTDAHLIL